jgi:hypothetical protein
MSEKALEKISYLLTCSYGEVGNFELARLSEVANLRMEMPDLFARLVDTSAFALLAAWLRTSNREDLKRRLLHSPDTALEQVMSQARKEIRNQAAVRKRSKTARCRLPGSPAASCRRKAQGRKRCLSQTLH